MAVALSITALPMLGIILVELKLLTTNVGQMAMAVAAVNDMVAWVILTLAISLSGTDKSLVISIYVLLCGIGFVVIMFLVVKPIMTRIGHHSPDHELISEISICITLAGVLVAIFATDTIGIDAIFGAFVFGLMIPKDGSFVGMLIEKIEDFVLASLLPLYFVSSGLKTDVATIHGSTSWGLLVLVIVTACAGKILGTFLVAIIHKVPRREALTLGFFMNTKGLVELIFLNIGKDKKVLNDEAFAILVLMAL
ncbi:cation H(+) antiporter 18-like, partial [Olea europaea subsp. europaea]